MRIHTVIRCKFVMLNNGLLFGGMMNNVLICMQW
jgi:hypothetical protein